MGGIGKNGGFGGSGGMIYLNGTFPMPAANGYGSSSIPDNLAYYNAKGGSSNFNFGLTPGCQNGGAGTVYFAIQ
jgi:hypothetical protein